MQLDAAGCIPENQSRVGKDTGTIGAIEGQGGGREYAEMPPEEDSAFRGSDQILSAIYRHTT